MSDDIDGGSGSSRLLRRWRESILPTYPTPPLALVRGEGARVEDVDGNTYLDFLSGIAVTSLGHGHPAVTRAVTEQCADLLHTSNLYATEPALTVAETLARLAGWDDARTFFSNSGAEANEAALKLARRHGVAQDPEKHRVVALEGSFHGRTLATLEATGQPDKHEPFQPLAGFVDHVPFDDADALREAVGRRTCAVLLEVVQGEGGVRPVSDGVLAAAAAACRDHDALLMVDEVQTGVGRTGRWFAWQESPIEPDVMTLAKGLGGGLPIGACVVRGRATEALQPGHHATTFGGNPVVCAAAAAVLRTLEEDDLVERAARLGARLREALEDWVDRAPLVAGSRGRGLLQGVLLETPAAKAVEAAARREGLLVGAAGPDVVRLAPPLILDDALLDEGLHRLARALEAAADGRTGNG